MEKLDYPWFRSGSVVQQVDAAGALVEIQDCFSEDYDVCSRLSTLGEKIYIDPSVKVSREKNLIIPGTIGR